MNCYSQQQQQQQQTHYATPDFHAPTLPLTATLSLPISPLPNVVQPLLCPISFPLALLRPASPRIPSPHLTPTTTTLPDRYRTGNGLLLSLRWRASQGTMLPETMAASSQGGTTAHGRGQGRRRAELARLNTASRVLPGRAGYTHGTG
ncbi:hypothetical protein PMIN03_011939 [Paraphaeosphaeria minitans]|uniref:Uncharacterized protein n=1 Tax=Paraphaeosphaeria minitans TaxID=565426 RepID=A0A9P6KMF2_9PLEO|nr:hypothetical protein PMIN01_09819 [Paraphaeosphaeria minitans]